MRTRKRLWCLRIASTPQLALVKEKASSSRSRSGASPGAPAPPRSPAPPTAASGTRGCRARSRVARGTPPSMITQSTKSVPTSDSEAVPLTSVVRTTMAMTIQATPRRAIGYFVTCSIRSTRSWRPPDGLAPAMTWRRRSSLRDLSSRRSCSRRSSRWMRSMEDGFFSGAAPPGAALTSVESGIQKRR